jgi:hypothetical protein
MDALLIRQRCGDAMGTGMTTAKNFLFFCSGGRALGR